MIFHRIIRKIVKIYRSNEEKTYLQQLGDHGSGVWIEYPCILSHAENIYISDGCRMLPYARIQTFPKSVKEKPTIRIGSGGIFGCRLCILAGDDILIGDNVIAASNVTIVSHNHGMDPSCSTPYKDQSLKVAPIVIGNNCWIGEGVTICAGVTIGDNVVIGAGSVVVSDIKENHVAAGIPAREIKWFDYENHQWERVEKRQ